jgi:predicted acylesterase/phospholipase RssA
MTQPGGGKTAFVLAGGGSLGAVQVGMLKALTRAGIVPDLVVGASVGAINGAYFAAQPDDAGVKRLENIWSRLHRGNIFPLSPLHSLLAILGRRDHLITSSPLRSLVESELPCEKLEDARIPCYVVATDVLDGTEVAIATGTLSTALLASAAIPAVFPHVTRDGRHLMDGAIANNTDLNRTQARRDPRDRPADRPVVRAGEAATRRGRLCPARAESSGHAAVAERHRAILRSSGARRRSPTVSGDRQRLRFLADRRPNASRRGYDSPVAEEERTRA